MWSSSSWDRHSGALVVPLAVALVVAGGGGLLVVGLMHALGGRAERVIEGAHIRLRSSGLGAMDVAHGDRGIGVRGLHRRRQLRRAVSLDVFDDGRGVVVSSDATTCARVHSLPASCCEKHDAGSAEEKRDLVHCGVHPLITAALTRPTGSTNLLTLRQCRPSARVRVTSRKVRIVPLAGVARPTPRARANWDGTPRDARAATLRTAQNPRRASV